MENYWVRQEVKSLFRGIKFGGFNRPANKTFCVYFLYWLLRLHTDFSYSCGYRYTHRLTLRAFCWTESQCNICSICSIQMVNFHLAKTNPLDWYICGTKQGDTYYVDNQFGSVWSQLFRSIKQHTPNSCYSHTDFLDVDHWENSNFHVLP